jgi:hypothetical protein
MMFRLYLTALCALAFSCIFGQSSSNTAYAITSKTYGAQEWTEVKEIDLSNGQVIRTVFENSNLYEVFDGRSLRRISVAVKPDSTTQSNFHPFSGLSAACAYDAKSNRLFYAPMFINQLRYIDLRKNVTSVYMFPDEQLWTGVDAEEEANQVTRMVIASDGNGYAMSNDGRHLVRFTTSGKPVVTDLGAVVDAPSNGDISISDANTSWGGDMIADASGSLIVISAHNHVFRINIDTRISTYITRINGLPESFTTNGAVVNSEGNIVVSSANYLTSYYTVDPHTWQATSVEPRQQVYNTSDLGNQNLLYQTSLNQSQIASAREQISVYPNPVKSKTFKVAFANQIVGNYNVQLVDVIGRTVTEGTFAVTTNSQISEVRLNPTLTGGVYIVKVLNARNREVYTKKIIVE